MKVVQIHEIPQDSFEPNTEPKNSPLWLQKFKNDSKIKSKSKGRIRPPSHPILNNVEQNATLDWEGIPTLVHLHFWDFWGSPWVPFLSFLAIPQRGHGLEHHTIENV